MPDCRESFAVVETTVSITICEDCAIMDVERTITFYINQPPVAAIEEGIVCSLIS